MEFSFFLVIEYDVNKCKKFSMYYARLYVYFELPVLYCDTKALCSYFENNEAQNTSD
jgi:hypothetical protein